MPLHLFRRVLTVLSCKQKVERDRFYGFAGTQLFFCHSDLLTSQSDHTLPHKSFIGKTYLNLCDQRIHLPYILKKALSYASKGSKYYQLETHFEDYYFLRHPEQKTTDAPGSLSFWITHKWILTVIITLSKKLERRNYGTHLKPVDQGSNIYTNTEGVVDRVRVQLLGLSYPIHNHNVGLFFPLHHRRHQFVHPVFEHPTHLRGKNETTRVILTFIHSSKWTTLTWWPLSVILS